MDNKNKTLTLLLIIALTAPNLMLVKSAVATDYPEFVDTSKVAKPSVPEFTITLADHSYDVAPVITSTTNPYNNKTTTTTQPGYHVKKVTIDLTIENQPYPSTIYGNTSYLFYFVRTKGHYAPDFDKDNQIVPFYIETTDYSFPNVMQSSLDYTVISLPTGDYIAGDEIDIQVAAVLSYECTFTRTCIPPMMETHFIRAANSNWSSIQTFKMPDILNSPNSTSQEKASNLAIPDSLNQVLPLLCILIGAVLFVVIIKKRKNKGKETAK